MVMSPEKYVLLRAKVLEMNSKSLEVNGAPKCHRHRRFCEMALPVVCLSACVCCRAVPRARCVGGAHTHMDRNPKFKEQLLSLHNRLPGSVEGLYRDDIRLAPNM